jgi:hypothetical protein
MRTKDLSGLHGVALGCSAMVLTLLLGSRPASADEPGPYAIGHRTVVLEDTSRNPDGSTPVTTPGRPLYVHIW